jgi:hypothetical protein
VNVHTIHDTLSPLYGHHKRNDLKVELLIVQYAHCSMSMNLDLPSGRGVDSLSIPSPSPPPMSTTSNLRSVSRSSSWSGQDSTLLSFRGNVVNVILPSVTPEMSQWIDDILLKVRNIHDYEDEEVIDQSGYD